MDRIYITADDREQPSGIPAFLASIPDVAVEIRHLHCGDYLLDNWLLVERKRLDDLLVSIIDGRLFSQASRLCQSPYKPLLIIEGTAKSISKTAFDRRAVLGAMVSLTLIFELAVLRSYCTQETAKLMLYAVQQKRTIDRDEINRGGYRPRSCYRRQLYILQGFPGIGVKLARALLTKFGSLAAIFAASEAQLIEVEGIGAAKALAIRLLLDKHYPALKSKAANSGYHN
ncbi:ERCC4 domain-containing protein [Lacimicrobium alkaliphilum]|uniref:ERCC4 domain-containing protein n=1 Tax=Lacimicrobium alkaliphilum TaxID=1526571 RepID=A0ABQ1RJ10_9ALTE|nr:ERCC4 domain-containing protein [Lacimicrobium alkaliphilum]GGD69578.1 hypothetical protein GCM10011357_25790 [Lacimicrobium alkaliphilum]